jgi:uncharacterized integral membrane protein
MSDTESPSQRAAEKARGAGRDWAPLVAALVLLLLVVIFVLQNGDKVPVKFLFAEGDMPLGAALLLAAVLGGLITLALGFVRRTRSRFRRR